jgi:suppressor of G2 allele of SKP1
LHIPTTTTTAMSDLGGRYRLQWYQSPDVVSLELFVKGLRNYPDKVRTKVEEKEKDHLRVEVDDGHADGAYVLDLRLFAPVKAEDTKVEVLSTKVEMKLVKVEGGRQWPDLVSPEERERREKEAAAAAASGSEPAADPQQHEQQDPADKKKKSPKDWNKLEAELAEMEKEEKPEGEAALQALFKDIYGKADEDTQRAMMKSFQESNGTVLSTNWNEVGKKKVEVQPPSGMEAKQYQQ